MVDYSIVVGGEEGKIKDPHVSVVETVGNDMEMR